MAQPSQEQFHPIGVRRSRKGGPDVNTAPWRKGWANLVSPAPGWWEGVGG